MNQKQFIASLQAYYGRMSPIHLEALAGWLSSKGFSEHYLKTLYQEIIAGHPTTYGKPVDLAIVREYHVDLSERYREPVEELDGRNRRMIGERIVDREEGAKLLDELAHQLAGKKRFCNSPANAQRN